MCFIVVCGVCALAPGAVLAQPAQPPQQPPPAAQAADPKKPDYGQWWLMDARDMPQRAPGWLIYAEGQGSFANSTGSVSGFNVAGGGNFAARRNITTNQFAISFNVQEARLEDNRGFFKQTTYRASDMVFVNVARPLNIITGIIYEKDEPKHVTHRVSYFGGVSRRFVKAHHKVGVIAAFGHESEDFTEPAVTEHSWALYFANTYDTAIQQRGMFSHNIEIVLDLENEKDRRINWSTGLQLQLNRHIGIGPALQVRYDSFPVLQVQKLDTMAMIAVRVTSR